MSIKEPFAGENNPCCLMVASVCVRACVRVFKLLVQATEGSKVREELRECDPKDMEGG